MIAAAYRHADGGDTSPEYQMLGYIEKFGVEAVTGKKVLGYGEMRRMIAAENIIAAYKSRASNENAAEWAAENKGRNEMLINAQKLAEELLNWDTGAA